MAPREQRLQQLARQVATCSRCAELLANRTQPVFASGNARARIMLVGEAPGAQEDLTGEPFVGRAGKRLDQLLRDVGIERKEVYVTNVVKCRPPKNRNPKPVELTNCREYLDHQLRLVQPRVLCALGTISAQSLLNTKESIGSLRGRIHEYRGLVLICTYHPAYVVRSPSAGTKVLEDLRRVQKSAG